MPRPLGVFAAALSVACSLAAAVALVWRLDAVPPIGFDEWYFVSRFDRAVAYGDVHDRVGFDQFANNGEHCKLPPLGLPLRLLIHRATGIGLPAARPISAGQVIVLGLLLAWAAARLGAPAPLALLGPAFLLSFPTVFTFARTFRYEQDTFFYGACSLLLPVVWPARRAAWLASGALAGAAASMHPMGSMFPVAVVVAALAQWRAARAEVVRVAPAWLLGLAVPALVTAAYYVADWANTLVYFEGTRAFHTLHHPFRVRALRALMPIASWIPDQPAAVLNALRYGLRLPGAAGSPLDGLLERGWSVAFVLVGAGAAFFLGRRMLRPRLPENARVSWPELIWMAAVVAAFLVTFGYAANTDYVLYLSGTVCMALFLAAAQRASTAPLRVAGGLWLALLAVTLLDLAAVATTFARTPGEARPTAPREVAALRAVARELALENPQGERFYADTASWAGAGRHLAPLHEYLILEIAPRRLTFGGVVFSASWYDTFVREIVPFTGRAIDVERRRQLMTDLAAPLSFAAGLFSTDSGGSLVDTRLWLTRERVERPLVGFLGPTGPLELRRADEVPPSLAEVEGRFAVPLRRDLPAGRYLALLTGSALQESRITARTPRAQRDGLPLRNFPHAVAGSAVVFETDGRAPVEMELTGHAAPAGTARVRFWRVAAE